MPSPLSILTRRVVLIGATTLATALPAFAQDTVKFGVVTALSRSVRQGRQLIVRGLSLAIDEINAKGGLLGKKVELAWCATTKAIPRRG